MATYTPNYGLHQWVPEDQFLRTDFNEDFKKIDTALGDAKQNNIALTQALSNMSYSVYYLTMKDYYESKYYGYRRALFMEDFDTQNNVASLGGELKIQAGGMVLGWAAAPATMTTIPIPLPGISWSRAIAWLKCSEGPEYSMTVNGVPLLQTGSWSSQSTMGTECLEIQFEADAPGSNTAVITLTMAPKDQIVARAYEYAVLFL